MRSLLLVSVSLALASCGDGTREDTAEELAIAKSDIALRDGFTLPAKFGPISKSELALAGAPNISWSYALPSSVDGDAVEEALKAQLEENGYTVSFDSETGFSATGPDGHEVALTVLNFSGQQSVSVTFTAPIG